ncbi:hypothetical protein Pmani_037734 [Petrolisthes manimaculis]|uniref:Uncharacterized protein n=1 Tax=Petrolisthes manimaculis TaxID=1843537 RepID=A0AAE1NIE0_9EUCA|nr:hypothetical protein Pmani_037734 [Petrolisthes manimaculis]
MNNMFPHNIAIKKIFYFSIQVGLLFCISYQYINRGFVLRTPTTTKETYLRHNGVKNALEITIEVDFTKKLLWGHKTEDLAHHHFHYQINTEACRQSVRLRLTVSWHWARDQGSTNVDGEFPRLDLKYP